MVAVFHLRVSCYSHIIAEVGSVRALNIMDTIGQVIVNPLHIHHTPQIGPVLGDGLLDTVTAVSLLTVCFFQLMSFQQTPPTFSSAPYMLTYRLYVCYSHCSTITIQPMSYFIPVSGSDSNVFIFSVFVSNIDLYLALFANKDILKLSEGLIC